MNLFIKIKKIIASVVLLCVLVSLVPVQVFAQATSTVNMSAYTGWDSVKSINDSYTGGDNKNASLSVAREGLEGKQFELTSVEKGGLLAKETVARGSSQSPFGLYKNYSNYTFFGVSTNDKRISYYAKDENGQIFLFAHARDGIVRFPNTKIPKGAGIGNSSVTDITSENGFINASDRASGKEINTYSTLIGITNKDKLQEQEKSIDESIAAIDKELEEISRGDSDENTEARRIALEENREELVKAKRDVSSARNLGATASESTIIDLSSCPSSITDIGAFATAPMCVVTVMAIIANSILKLSAFVLYWTGNLFDYSIEIAVNSAEFLKKLNVIEPTWAFVRDALNMTFIFILLYIAVQILLGKGGYTAKGSIARLVIVAILMNFSLFAAKAMIDASNIISLNIYEGIKSRQNGQERGNVSERIMTTLGLSGVYNFGEIFDKKAIPGCGGAPGTILTVGIFGTILLIITSLTFLLAAVLFFLRMLNILVLFITSPIYVWGHAMESEFFRKKTNAWWSSMKHAISFPIIYMLMLYVALAMFAQLNSAQQASGNRVSLIKLICDTSQTADASVFDKLPLILNFLLVIMSLVGIIMYAAKKSGDGGLATGKLSSQFSEKINNLQKKITTGAAQGVYNKSRDAVVGTGNLALAGAGKVKDASLTLAKDVTRMGGNWASNKIADKLAKAATGQGTLGEKLMNMPKVQTYLANKSAKYKDRKIFGETEKAAFERRTKSALESEKILQKVQSEQLKVESMKDWQKKNPKGTPAQYREYLEEKVNLRMKTLLPGLANLNAGKDEEGKDITTEDLVRTRVIEEIKDKDDNITGYRLEEEKLFKNIQNAAEYHKKNKTDVKTENSRRWGILLSEKSQARIKARKDQINKELSEVRNKKSGKESKLKDAREQLERLPTDFEDISSGDKRKYNSIVVSYINERDKILQKMEAELRSTKTPEEELRVKEAAYDDLDDLKLNTKDKIKDERNKIENNIAKWEKDIEAEKEKKEAKENKDKK